MSLLFSDSKSFMLDRDDLLDIFNSVRDYSK